MLDFLHLPKPQNGTIDYFPGFSNTTASLGSWEVWNKPRGCTFIRILCIGGGAGGVSGFPSATTNARGGGGGGSSASIAHVTYPAVFLPDRLYVSPGVKGIGGASSTTISNAGTRGGTSYVCIAPSTSNIYIICTGVAGFSPVASTSTTVGSATGASAPTIASANLGFQGHFNGLASDFPGTGGAVTGAVGNSVAYPTTGLFHSSGAGGGGGAGFAGGNQTQPASQTSVYTLFQTLTGGVAGSAGSTIGGNGSNGIELYQPLMFCGGSGGGSSFDGTARGGNGGNGGFGSGGGGGGAGGTNGGGAGGDGGPGLVVIQTW